MKIKHQQSKVGRFNRKLERIHVASAKRAFLNGGAL